MKLFFKDFEKPLEKTESFTDVLKSIVKKSKKLNEPCEIVLETGEYDIYPDELFSVDINVSNTISEEEFNTNGEAVTTKRNTPVLFEGLSNITLNGEGSLIRCHGKMTQIILKDCENIAFKNIKFDYVNPTVTEMTVINIGKGYTDCIIPEYYPYKIVDRKIVWYGENYSFSSGISQLFSPETGMTWRRYGPMDDKNAKFEDLGNRTVRLYYEDNGCGENPYGAKLGYVFQMRDPTRDECGVIVSNSKDISFINVTMHFMSGIGFVVQNSENIYLNGFNVYPSLGRTASCAADFMHFSGCRGKIIIENGYYIGAHDDAINVHGTHLKITEVDRDKNEVKIRFMHPQTYGIGGYLVGDEVGAVEPNSLSEKAKTKVLRVCEISPRETVLTLESVDGFETDLMIENITANAEVTIRNNHFERIPTRGILVTTSKPVLIENNEFVKVTGCGVLIADDARSWYESGYVTDVLIEKNTYIESHDSFVKIEPECIEEFEGTVHSGIKIVNNLIEICKPVDVLYARNTEGLDFKNNTMFGNADNYSVTLKNVKESSVVGNKYNGKEI